MLTLFIVIACE